MDIVEPRPEKPHQSDLAVLVHELGIIQRGLDRWELYYAGLEPQPRGFDRDSLLRLREQLLREIERLRSTASSDRAVA
jgi:hypothetical protein